MMLNRLPASYRRGSLLAKLRLDCAGLEFEPDDDTRGRFRCEKTRLELVAEECVESRFLMHIVTTRFSCPIACEGGAPAILRIRHRGNWKRTGLECAVIRGAENDEIRQAAGQLEANVSLNSAMLPLDFTQFELHRAASGWIAALVHYGASEVVYHFPATRQYVRLAPGQLQGILKTFACLRDLLSPSTRTVPASE